MSQRKEKYARNMERRTVMVEQRMDSLDRRMSRAAVESLEHERRIWEIEDTLKIRQENHHRMREIERGVVVALLLEVLLAVVILIVAVNV